MSRLRNRRFRGWVARGVAVAWLFCVAVSAFDGDPVAAAFVTPAQATAGSHSGSPLHNGDDSRNDGCCHLQAGALASVNAFKLHSVATQPLIVTFVVLFVLLLPAFVTQRLSVPVNTGPPRRSFHFLVHSLQAQAPPC